MGNYIIRLEKTGDYRETENLIRESFWNVYRPGCSEHYVMHVLRDDPAFIPELDFVMEQDGRLIGQNMFMKTVINADDGWDIPVLPLRRINLGSLPTELHSDIPAVQAAINDHPLSVMYGSYVLKYITHPPFNNFSHLYISDLSITLKKQILDRKCFSAFLTN